jgi:hypothetical protein
MQEVASGRVIHRSVSAYKSTHEYVAPHVSFAYKHSHHVLSPAVAAASASVRKVREAIAAELRKDRYKTAMDGVGRVNSVVAKQWQQAAKHARALSNHGKVQRPVCRFVFGGWDAC